MMAWITARYRNRFVSLKKKKDFNKILHLTNMTCFRIVPNTRHGMTYSVLCKASRVDIGCGDDDGVF